MKNLTATTQDLAVKADTKVSEKKVLEEPTPVKEDKKILVEEVQAETVVEEPVVEEKPKKKTSKKKAE